MQIQCLKSSAVYFQTEPTDRCRWSNWHTSSKNWFVSKQTDIDKTEGFYDETDKFLERIVLESSEILDPLEVVLPSDFVQKDEKSNLAWEGHTERKSKYSEEIYWVFIWKI